MARDKNNPNSAADKAPEAEPEAVAPEPTPAPAEDAPAGKSDEQKAAEKAQREAEAAQAEVDLKNVIDVAISGAVVAEDGTTSLTPEHAEQLQLAYRKIAAGARGRVQAEILRDKMSQEGVSMAAVAAVLEVMTKAPASKPKSTRVAKPQRPAFELVAEGLTILALAQRTLLEELESDEDRTKAREASKAALQSDITDDGERDALLARVKRVARAAGQKRAASKGSGGTGERIAHSDTIKAMFDRGDLSVGTKLTHGNSTASINAEGKIVVDGHEGAFDNPTAAATVILKAEGKSVQVNGWSWWNVVNGDTSSPLGDLRKG